MPWIRLKPLVAMVSPLLAVSCTTDNPKSSVSAKESQDIEAACGSLAAASEAQWSPQADVPSTAESSPERVEALGAWTWERSLHLLKISPESESTAVSPVSMAMSLGLSYGRYEGGQCGQQILDAMKYPETGADLHQTLGAVARELESRSAPGDEMQPPISVSVSSSVWELSEGSPGDPPPMNELTSWYGIRHHQIDGSNIGAAREVINCAIETESAGLLPDFLPPGLPAADTTSFDISVVALQAPWESALSQSPVSFDDGSGAEEIDGMSGDGFFGVFKSEAFDAIDVPLLGPNLSVMMVRPSADSDLDALAAELTAADLIDATTQSVTEYITLRMPTVSVPNETVDFADPLGIECELFTLRTVLHGSRIKMDPNGLRAAAATVAESWQTSGQPYPEDEFVLDRPFLFFVHDRPTKAVLFAGRYTGR